MKMDIVTRREKVITEHPQSVHLSLFGRNRLAEIFNVFELFVYQIAPMPVCENQRKRCSPTAVRSAPGGRLEIALRRALGLTRFARVRRNPGGGGAGGTGPRAFEKHRNPLHSSFGVEKFDAEKPDGHCLEKSLDSCLKALPE